jgi:hypothetical protein
MCIANRGVRYPLKGILKGNNARQRTDGRIERNFNPFTMRNGIVFIAMRDKHYSELIFAKD